MNQYPGPTRPMGPLRWIDADPGPICSEWAYPSEEISFGSMLPKVSADAAEVSAFPGPDDSLALIVQQNHAVKALHSDDGGETFAPAVSLAGGPGQLDAVMYRAELASDGALYVAMMVADPGGELGLQVARSVDRGRTFAPAVDLVRHGDAVHGLLPSKLVFALAAGPSGRAAVVFSRGGRSLHYVMASTDGGASWNAPVRTSPVPAPDPLGAGAQRCAVSARAAERSPQDPFGPASAPSE